MADHDAADLSAGRFSIRLLSKPQFADPLIRRLEQDSQKTPPMVIEGPDQDMALTASLAVLVNEPLANRLTLELSCTPGLPPLTAAARCSAVAERAAASGARATESSAWLCEAEAWHRAGEHTRSANSTTRVLDDLLAFVPSGIFWPGVRWLAWRVFGAVGNHEAAQQALASGLGWVQDHALQQVPPEFRGSFLQCNPINRQLLMAAKAQGLT